MDNFEYGRIKLTPTTFERTVKWKIYPLDFQDLIFEVLEQAQLLIPRQTVKSITVKTDLFEFRSTKLLEILHKLHKYKLTYITFIIKFSPRCFRISI